MIIFEFAIAPAGKRDRRNPERKIGPETEPETAACSSSSTNSTESAGKRPQRLQRPELVASRFVEPAMYGSRRPWKEDRERGEWKQLGALTIQKKGEGRKGAGFLVE